MVDLTRKLDFMGNFMVFLYEQLSASANSFCFAIVRRRISESENGKPRLPEEELAHELPKVFSYHGNHLNNRNQFNLNLCLIYNLRPTRAKNARN